MRRASGVALAACFLAMTSTQSLAQMYPYSLTDVPLTKLDLQDMAAAYQPLLNDDSLPIGTKREWSNSESGNSGTVQLLKRFDYKYQGTPLPCRELRYHVIFKDRVDPYNFKLNRCKVADGSWKIL
jgi:surface antigen